MFIFMRLLTVDSYDIMQSKYDQNDMLIVMVKNKSNKSTLISLWRGNKQ